MENIANKQEMMFDCLKHIQEQSVVFALAEHKENDSLEDLCNKVSAETIYRIMEWIDGYGHAADQIGVDLIDKQTGASMKQNIELHDKCIDYLR
jgi:hypothetical protein